VGTPGANQITGSFSITGVTSANPYSFSYVPAQPNSYGVGSNPIKAVLVGFSGNTIGPATVSGGVVNVNLVNFVGTFEAVNPSNGQTQLLSFDFSSASTQGNDIFSAFMSFSDGGADTATININYRTPGTAADHADIFDSDFVDLNNPNASGKYYKRENLTINISASDTIDTNANGTIQNFTGDPGFQFNSDPRPPATPATPAMLSALIGVAVGGLQFGTARYRRRSRRTPAA